MVNKKRAARRDRTPRIAQRRRAVHLQRGHGGDEGQVDCICELADTYFAKRPLGCGCTKRRKGQPRGCGGKIPWRYDVFTGLWRPGPFQWMGCKDGVRRRIYRWRQAVREWRQGIVSSRIDLDSEPAPLRKPD